MQVARDAAGGHALVVLTVDSEIPPAVLSELSEEIGATTVRVVDLDS
jgi:D-3-phosphoglycerate dehydrogenase